MRVAFGITSLVKGLSTWGIDGIGIYTKELYARLPKWGVSSILPVTFGTCGKVPGLDNVTPVGGFSWNAGLSMILDRPFMGCQEKFRGVDLFHSPDHRIPNLGKLPVIATIHDVIFIEYPEWTSFRYPDLMASMFKRSAKWAHKIITVSEYSKGKIEEHLGIPGANICVVNNGVDDSWFNRIDPAFVSQIKEKNKIKNPYVICVGTLQPRKNVERLLDAFQRLPKSFRSAFDLLVVGRAGWNCSKLVDRLRAGECGSSIKWLDYVQKLELQALVKGAQALVVPSLSEGFGLPVVEAFAAGIPVVCSNVTSLPEVAGDAAVLVDPLQIDSIAEGIQRILSDESLASALSARGLERARKFSWETCVEKTVNAYRQLI